MKNKNFPHKNAMHHKTDEEIKKEINDIKENTINGISFFTGKFNNKDVVFVQSGIGKVNAAITTTLLIEKFDVKEVIFSGVAGSLDERLKIGDVVVGRDIVQHDVDATAFGYKMGQIPQMKEWAFESDKNLIEKTGNITNFYIFFTNKLISSQNSSK